MIIGIMWLIALAVPTYEVTLANTLNATLHGFVAWTHVVVLSGVLSGGDGWLAVGLYAGAGMAVMIVVSGLHWVTFGQCHRSAIKEANKMEAERPATAAAGEEEPEVALAAVVGGSLRGAKGGSISAAIALIEAPRRRSKRGAPVATLALRRGAGKPRKKPRKGIRSVFVPDTPA